MRQNRHQIHGTFYSGAILMICYMFLADTSSEITQYLVSAHVESYALVPGSNYWALVIVHCTYERFHMCGNEIFSLIIIVLHALYKTHEKPMPIIPTPSLNGTIRQSLPYCQSLTNRQNL